MPLVHSSRPPADRRLAVHERNRAKCEGCGEAIDCTALGHAQFVSGWAVNRKGGGTHAIALPERSLRWLCRFCLDRRRSTGWQQPELDLFA